VGAELSQTVLVDVLDTGAYVSTRLILRWQLWDAHARGTPGDLAAFLHAFEFTAAVGLGLAHHVVIIVGLAPRANKV
jgi:hypothetical protein